MRRLNIYFVHSSKNDYKNLLYKPILTSPVCVFHELMLPLTDKYKDKYVKDLLKKADLIIAEVSTPSFGLGLELKWLSKWDKPKLFISLNNKVPKKYNKYVNELSLFTKEKPIIKIIEDFVSKYANMSDEEIKDTSIVLGDL